MRRLFCLLPLLAALRGSVMAQTSPETSDVSVANIRKALAAEQAAIAAHPNDTSAYINLAYTFLDAGMGEQARNAAADAIRVAPASALAYTAQGFVLHHNSIGVNYGKGFDYDGALGSLHKAIDLAPADLDVRESLANLLEFNRDGVRYASDSQLSQAIDTYRYIKQHRSSIKDEVVDNLAIDLFYAGRYAEALAEVEPLPPTPQRRGIAIASIAALKGSATAIAVDAQISGEQPRKNALNFAAEGLWNMRLYPLAADILTASLPDTENGPAISAKVQLFRSLKPYTPPSLAVDDPRLPVQRLMEAVFTSSANETLFRQFVSRHSYATEDAWQAALLQANQSSAILISLMKWTRLPRPVLVDLTLGHMSIVADAANSGGTPIRVQAISMPKAPFFVILENGVPKIAATGNNLNEISAQALYLMTNGQLAAAAGLLDWHASLTDTSQTQRDPLGGNLFAHFWPPSKNSTSRNATPALTPTLTPTLAALTPAVAALTFDPSLLSPLPSQILALRNRATTAELRTRLDLLLAELYIRLKNASSARPIVTRLLSQYPDSLRAVQMMGLIYQLDGNDAAWRSLLADRLRGRPTDRPLLLESALEASAQGDFARARQTYRLILDGPQSTPEDSTLYAWVSLAANMADEPALAAARQAALARLNRSYTSFLTLACINAAQGNTAEARQELLDAMAAASLTEPDAGIWYGFGRIFEQYGVPAAAAAAYTHALEKQSTLRVDEAILPPQASIAILAQSRLDALKHP